MILTSIVFAQEKKNSKDESMTRPVGSSESVTRPVGSSEAEAPVTSSKSVTRPVASSEAVASPIAKVKSHSSNTTSVPDVVKQDNSLKKKKPITSFHKNRYRKFMPKWMKEDGLLKDRFLTWAGIGKYLYGYRDERYADIDKGAYLKADTLDMGMEYYKSDFGSYIPLLKDIRAGFNIAFKKRSKITPKTLNGILNIPTKTVPEDEKIINAESWLNLGFLKKINYTLNCSLRGINFPL